MVRTRSRSLRRLLALAGGGAWAQQPPTVRVAGTVESFDGQVLAIKSAKLGEVKINLTDNVAVFGVSKATIADIKPGAFIGVGAMPQPDGSQRAIQVTMFAEVQRGLGEGHRPWDARPNSTMTNGAVEQTGGQRRWPGGDGQIQGRRAEDRGAADAAILAYAVGDKDELKPAPMSPSSARMKKPDGSLEANRVNVGRGEVVRIADR